MGARPLWCTLALSLPDGSAHWVDEFAAGFMALADREQIALIGGDTVRGPLSLTVTVHGSVERGAAVMRSGAEPGHDIYITGTPGRAAAGLALFRESGDRIPGSSELTDRFLYPQPRVREGRDVARIASAMIDMSDGLHVDLTRLLAASRVGARLDIEAIPLSAEARERFGDDAALEFALTGGDDYELCMTVPHEFATELERMAGRWDCGITRIGVTRDDIAVGWFERGHPRAIDDTSFRHFAAEDR
jgi:thiamine-monophosphate kinase